MDEVEFGKMYISLEALRGHKDVNHVPPLSRDHFLRLRNIDGLVTNEQFRDYHNRLAANLEKIFADGEVKLSDFGGDLLSNLESFVEEHCELVKASEVNVQNYKDLKDALLNEIRYVQGDDVEKRLRGLVEETFRRYSGKIEVSDE